jgi:hypothetical protein
MRFGWFVVGNVQGKPGSAHPRKTVIQVFAMESDRIPIARDPGAPRYKKRRQFSYINYTGTLLNA